MASGMATFMAACATDVSNPGTTTVDDPTLGRVYQWQKDDLLMLVSGLQPMYHPGQEIRFHLTLNNQTEAPIDVRVRTKLLGRGQQAVVEAEVYPTTVPAEDAVQLDRVLPLPRGLPPEDYVLQVELPPWVRGSGTVGGGALLAPVRVTT